MPLRSAAFARTAKALQQNAKQQHNSTHSAPADAGISSEHKKRIELWAQTPSTAFHQVGRRWRTNAPQIWAKNAEQINLGTGGIGWMSKSSKKKKRWSSPVRKCVINLLDERFLPSPLSAPPVNPSGLFQNVWGQTLNAWAVGNAQKHTFWRVF